MGDEGSTMGLKDSGQGNECVQVELSAFTVCLLCWLLVFLLVLFMCGRFLFYLRFRFFVSVDEFWMF